MPDEQLDERLLKITIELNNGAEKFEFEKLAMVAIGTKHMSAVQNFAEIRIANMDKSVRDTLLTEGTPFSLLDTPENSILIEAGRESTGLSQIFIGDITTVNVTEPPDIWLTMRAITGQFAKGFTVQFSQSGQSKFSAIGQQVADILGVSFDFRATDKNVSNFSFTGAPPKLVNALGKISNRVVAYIDDDTLIIQPRDTPALRPAADVNINTGLILTPRFTDFGVSCTTLLTRDVKLGDDINLTSEAYPSTTGLYGVYKLGFNLANRDTPFYYNIEASRKNISGFGLALG